jgi:hypothetical protein
MQPCRAPSAGAPPTDHSVQVIVEIEARAVTVERLFMISERQEWTFGETLEYALDAIELALAKNGDGVNPEPLQCAGALFRGGRYLRCPPRGAQWRPALIAAL